MKMENAEEILQFLEEFSKRKTKNIPQELNDYLAYVARTGDPVYQWPLVKCLFKEKLLNVITDFYETTPGIDIPPYPNVDPFNYDIMKNSLLERLDSFTSAPFTVQRICELLTYPRKQYNRVDKFMRAIEKNILVVSTREPGIQRHIEAENGEPMEPIVNGSDNNSEYNVDVEMEDMSWKENSEPQQSTEPQPSSSDTHISVDDIEARLKAKQDAPMDIQDKVTAQYESVTPPELNVTTDEPAVETKSDSETTQEATSSIMEDNKTETMDTVSDKPKIDVEMKSEDVGENKTLAIPEIKVDDAEMTEQRLTEEANTIKVEEESEEKAPLTESKTNVEDQQTNIDESSSDSISKEETDNKVVSDVQTSSEESSSSSDNTDGNSNSPKAIESQSDIPEESSQSDSNIEEEKEEKQPDPVENTTATEEQDVPTPTIQNDNYSISDVQSELPQPVSENSPKEISLETPQETSSPPDEEEKKEKPETAEDVKAPEVEPESS